MGSFFGGGDNRNVAEAVRTEAAPPPVVNEEPKPTPTASPESLRRMGRASLLINTSAKGILGDAKTGRKQLLSA